MVKTRARRARSTTPEDALSRKPHTHLNTPQKNFYLGMIQGAKSVGKKLNKTKAAKEVHISLTRFKHVLKHPER